MGMSPVAPFRLSRDRAVAILREAAAATDRVIFTDHAKQQMAKRRITVSQVLRCLARGSITEGLALDLRGGWSCRVERRG